MIINSEYFDLEKICKSGQNNRYKVVGENRYRLISLDKILYIQKTDNGWELLCEDNEYEEYWKSYFDMSTDYEKINGLIKPADTYLKEAASYSKGIRILNQDKWYTLITFIISQRKSLPAIMSSVEKLCKTCGTYIGRKDKESIYAFPTPNQILSTSDKKLGTCGLGYRLDYIKSAAAICMYDDTYLEKLNTQDDEALLVKLMEFHGIGPKIAKCIMLFGYKRYNAFPVDVWIKRALEDNYSTSDFDFSSYEPFCGIMQQYIFYYYREKNK